MHSKSDNVKIMISDEADEVIKKYFDSLKNRYQNNSILKIINFKKKKMLLTKEQQE